MSEPLVAVVRADVIENVILCDGATAELFRELDVFPGAELVDVTRADPRPGIGWHREGDGWVNPTPPTPPDPEPEPDGEDEPASEPAG